MRMRALLEHNKRLGIPARMRARKGYTSHFSALLRMRGRNGRRACANGVPDSSRWLFKGGSDSLAVLTGLQQVPCFLTPVNTLDIRS